MTIKTYNNNDMGQNTYLYYDEKSREGVLIDAGCGAPDLKSIAADICENKITLLALLLTHGHYDHIIAIHDILKTIPTKICCHENERPMLENPYVNFSALMGAEISIKPDKVLRDGDIIPIGDCALKVLHTPGHTPGGVCYYDEAGKILFSGDALFLGSIGRTDFPNGNYQELIMSINIKLMKLPDDVKVFPGHGDYTEIGYEKSNNPFING